MTQPVKPGALIADAAKRIAAQQQSMRDAAQRIADNRTEPEPSTEESPR